MISKKTAFFSIIILVIIPFSSISYYIFADTNLHPTNVVADDVPDVDLSELPQIDHYSIINEWKNPKIEMLIIVPPNKPDFVKAVEPLADWKNKKGVKTVILNDTSFTNAENIRNIIKDYYETENIRWVLLCGDTDLIPIKSFYNPLPLTETIAGDYKPTDFYYADLTSDWNDLNFNDWSAEAYVGRLPANDVNELRIMINKTLKYEMDPEIGDWMNEMLLAGGISDTVSEELPDGEDEARLTDYIAQHYTKLEMNYTHLARWTYYEPQDPKMDLNSSSFIDRFNEGYSTVIFAGHGGPKEYSDHYYADNNGLIYSDTNAGNALNFNKTSLIYADACTTAPYDQESYDDSNIGEILIKKQEAGAIGYIGTLRVSLYYTDDTDLEALNRGNAKLFWKEFFQEKKFQPGRALYDSKFAYVNTDYYKNKVHPNNMKYEYKNLMTYCLLGDPEVDIYTDIPINASNPFKGYIFEAQMVSTVIKNDNGKAVPYARVNLRTEDGKYYTAYADINGKVNFRLPAQAGEKYNVTITGHNLIPSYFNFSTLPDNLVPEISDEDCSPDEPTVYDDVCFEVNTYDLQSGLESVFLLQSEDDDFDEYSYYRMLNSFRDDEDNLYKHTIHNLEPGKHSFLIVARDWADNYHILDDDSFEFTIATPIMDYILIIMSIAVISITGISIFITYKGFKNYKYNLFRLE